MVKRQWYELSDKIILTFYKSFFLKQHFRLKWRLTKAQLSDYYPIYCFVLLILLMVKRQWYELSNKVILNFYKSFFLKQHFRLKWRLTKAQLSDYYPIYCFVFLIFSDGEKGTAYRTIMIFANHIFLSNILDPNDA